MCGRLVIINSNGMFFDDIAVQGDGGGRMEGFDWPNSDDISVL